MSKFSAYLWYKCEEVLTSTSQTVLQRTDLSSFEVKKMDFYLDTNTSLLYIPYGGKLAVRRSSPTAETCNFAKLLFSWTPG